MSAADYSPPTSPYSLPACSTTRQRCTCGCNPVRATHLLEESRKLFEGRLRTHPDDAVAVEELAETHHLLARLLLHARIRPEREADAYAMSLEHTRAAELAYQRLG